MFIKLPGLSCKQVMISFSKPHPWQCNHQYQWHSKETGPEAWEIPVADEQIQGS